MIAEKSNRSGVAVITGTTHGIGRVTARELARAGLRVAMLCRNTQAAADVRGEILQALPEAQIDVVHCDLASLDSVRVSAAAVRERYDSIQLLINNAGIVTALHRMSPDGFELMFATNHLGPFLLTHLLLDKVATDGGRIINVASRAHYRGQLALEDIRNPHARFRARAAYAQSKLANVMHAFALARRLSHTRIDVNCLHPGIVATNLLPRWLRLIKPLLSPVILDAEQGARTTVHLALASEVAGISGRYFDEYQAIQPASPLADDVELQERLWQTSEAWVGIRGAV